MNKIQPGLYLVMKNRSNYYKLISEFFKNPSNEDLLKGFKDNEFKDLTEEPAKEYNELEEGINLIYDFVKEEDKDELTKKIEEDYKNIFDGDFSATESSCLDLNKSSKKELINELKNTYEEENFDLEQEPADFELDHIYIEASYLLSLIVETRKHIINRNADKVKELTRSSSDFFYDHIVTWFPSFAKELEERSSTAYFKGMAKLIDTFIEIDKDVVSLASKEKKSWLNHQKDYFT